MGGGGGEGGRREGGKGENGGGWRVVGCGGRGRGVGYEC